MSKAVKIVIIILFVAAIGGVAYAVMASRGMFEKEQESNVTSIQGELGCLPLKDGTTPSEKDCRLGVRNPRGMYVELQGSLSGHSAGAKVEVTGEITATPSNSKYTSIGVLKVHKLLLL
jgi:hypothetical protein